MAADQKQQLNQKPTPQEQKPSSKTPKVAKFEIPAFKGRSKDAAGNNPPGKTVDKQADKFEIPPFQGVTKQAGSQDLWNKARQVSNTDWSATPGLGRAEVAYAKKLEWLYRIHCPNKISQIPSMLARYRGIEDQLLSKEYAKYGRSTDITTLDDPPEEVRYIHSTAKVPVQGHTEGWGNTTMICVLPNRPKRGVPEGARATGSAFLRTREPPQYSIISYYHMNRINISTTRMY
eukprot:1192551-Prorocentrum_minimum.AAC.1